MNIFTFHNVEISLFILLFINSPGGNDIWGWTNGDDDYAIVGTTGGTSFVRVTDPENPEVLAFMVPNS